MPDDIHVGHSSRDIRVVMDAAFAVNGEDGIGIPDGGITGQVLVKQSLTDFDVAWDDPQAGLPTDGTTGQVLTKLTDAPLDTIWADVSPGVPSNGLTNQVLGKLSDTDYDVGWQTVAGINDFVAKTGSTMTGELILYGDPSVPLAAATKQYIDVNYYPITGGVVHGHVITDVGNMGVNNGYLYVSRVGEATPAVFYMDSEFGQYSAIILRTMTDYRWLLGKDDSDAFVIRAYPGGVFSDNPIKIALSTGITTFSIPPIAPTPTAGDNSTKLATTAFVTAAVAAGGGGGGGGGQPLDATLTALAALNSTAGLVEQTGVDAFTKRLIGVTNTTDIPTRANGDARWLLQSSYTAADVLAKLITVDGAGSGIDADLLDGQSSTYYLAYGNFSGTPTLGTAAAKNTGTSGNTVPLLDGANTWSATQTFAAISSTAITSSGNITADSGTIFVNRAGDAVGAYVYMGADATSDAGLKFQMGGIAAATSRWYFGKDVVAESGSNAGSNLHLWVYSDTGTSLGRAFLVTRSSKIVTFDVSPVVPTPTFPDNSTKVATTAYVTTAMSSYTAADVLAKLITVDGVGSGLDADLLDGLSSAAFATASHTHVISDVTSLQTTLDAKEILGQVAGINTQSASYTLVLTDAGKVVEINNASANNLTIPLNSSVAFPINTRIDISQLGAGQTTIVPTGGVTIRQRETKLKLAGQYAGASLYKRATDEWVLFGDLSA